MSVVKPIELTPGLARNQTLTGRVCLLDSATVGKVGRANDYVELHLVVEEGLSGTLYIEAWRDQARRLIQVAKDGKILKLTNLTIKALGENTQWQCTPLDIYGQVLATAHLEEVADSDQYPANVHTVLLSDLPMYTHIPHLVNLAAVFVDGAASDEHEGHCSRVQSAYGRQRPIRPSGTVEGPRWESGRGKAGYN